MITVEFDFLFSGSSIRHTGSIEVKKDRAYSFSKASQQVHDHIAKKYGWSSENIVEINIRLKGVE